MVLMVKKSWRGDIREQELKFKADCNRERKDGFATNTLASLSEVRLAHVFGTTKAVN